MIDYLKVVTGLEPSSAAILTAIFLIAIIAFRERKDSRLRDFREELELLYEEVRSEHKKWRFRTEASEDGKEHTLSGKNGDRMFVLSWNTNTIRLSVQESGVHKTTCVREIEIPAQGQAEALARDFRQFCDDPRGKAKGAKNRRLAA